MERDSCSIVQRGGGKIRTGREFDEATRIHRDVLCVGAVHREAVLAVSRINISVVETNIVAPLHTVAAMAATHGRASGHEIARLVVGNTLPHRLNGACPLMADDEGPFGRPHRKKFPGDNTDICSADSGRADAAKHLGGPDLWPGHLSLKLVFIRLKDHHRFHGRFGHI